METGHLLVAVLCWQSFSANTPKHSAGSPFCEPPAHGVTQSLPGCLSQGAAVEPMGVDHRGPHILVAQQLLDGVDVLAPLQQMGGKGMAEGMAAGGLGDPCSCHSLLHGPLHQGGIDGMAPLKATAGIPPAILLGEHPRPAPVAIGVGVCPRQFLRHQHLSPTGCQVRPML
jgi:hypothetical protein